MDINRHDYNKNVPNDDGLYYNRNQEVNQNSQGNNNEPPMQFNTMLLESYDSSQYTGMKQQVNEEFSFPFSQEPDTQLEEMFFFLEW